MAATGVAGAIYDPDATQGTGALSTGIGIGINSVYGPPDAKWGFTVGGAASALRIGGGLQAMNAIGYAGKGLSWRLNDGAAAVADGAAMPGTTSLNRSGKSCPVGGYLWAVAP
jgi:hypothetical protein